MNNDYLNSMRAPDVMESTASMAHLKSHKTNCAELRNIVTKHFVETQTGNLGLFHAIDSYEKEPELRARIAELESSFREICEQAATLGQAVMIAKRALS